MIDNASGEETARYLTTLKNVAGLDLVLVRNEKNEGFVKAVNKGIRLSQASYVCILNNDTITTSGWLKTMLEVAESREDIAIVNPSSNNLGQRPAEGEPMELYAERLKQESGGFVELGAAIGFCMLIKRSVIDRIGLFDEIYGMGNFEDTDFSRRAVKEGFVCVRACGAYVYHRESSSFRRLKTFEDDFKRNKVIYEFRWGRPKRLAYIMDRYDANILKKVFAEAMKYARGGNWVAFYSKEPLELPRHSNIRYAALPADRFHLRAAFDVLKRKKKFDEIYVGEERFGRLMEYLSFIHKARVGYY
jgi:GT2 family glycosyltransferase